LLDHPFALSVKYQQLLQKYLLEEFNVEIDFEHLAQKVSLDELKSIANKIFELGANQLNANEKRIAQSYKNEIDELIWNLEFKYKNRKITVPDPVVLEKAKLKIAQKLLIHDQDDLSSEELEIYNANKKEIDSVKTQLIESINNKNKKNDQ